MVLGEARAPLDVRLFQAPTGVDERASADMGSGPSSDSKVIIQS